MKLRTFIPLAILLGTQIAPAQQLRTVQVRTSKGVVEGAVSADNIRAFKGIPFAAPPTGALRWKAPQPVAAWAGVRKATEFGPRCMQARIFADMVFRDNGPSEDCLYLNVWAPEGAFAKKKPKKVKLPVMFWIYGGGFVAGGTSEPRQDGGNLSTKGVVVVSCNYRLEAGGPGSVRTHGQLLDEFCEDRQSQWPRPAPVAGLPRGGRLPGDAPEREFQGRAR